MIPMGKKNTIILGYYRQACNCIKTGLISHATLGIQLKEECKREVYRRLVQENNNCLNLEHSDCRAFTQLESLLAFVNLFCYLRREVGQTKPKSKCTLNVSVLGMSCEGQFLLQTSLNLTAAFGGWKKMIGKVIRKKEDRCLD